MHVFCQKLKEESISMPTALATLLTTTDKGRLFLDKLLTNFPECGYTTDKGHPQSDFVCAAPTQETAKAFIQAFKNGIQTTQNIPVGRVIIQGFKNGIQTIQNITVGRL
jgi:hypothetical protein